MLYKFFHLNVLVSKYGLGVQGLISDKCIIFVLCTTSGVIKYPTQIFSWSRVWLKQ